MYACIFVRHVVLVDVQTEDEAWRVVGRDDSGPIVRSYDSARTFSSQDGQSHYNKLTLLAAAKERFDRNS